MVLPFPYRVPEFAVRDTPIETCAREARHFETPAVKIARGPSVLLEREARRATFDIHWPRTGMRRSPQ